MLNHIKRVRISSLLKTVIMGFMVNSILPARAGEVYRAFFLNKLEKISKSTILATVVLERITDGLVIGIGIVYIFLIDIIHLKIFYHAGYIAGGVYISAIAINLPKAGYAYKEPSNIERPMRLIIVHNPYAEYPLHKSLFADPEDEHYELVEGKWINPITKKPLLKN
jgi:hypothetical protein